jgi:hypothetical protein
MFTTMKLPEVDMFPVPSLWILNPVPWTLFVLVLSDNSSDPITSFSDKLELVTTGPRVTTLKVLSLLTLFLMLLEKKLKVATASRASKLPTPSEVVPDLVWVPF